MTFGRTKHIMTVGAAALVVCWLCPAIAEDEDGSRSVHIIDGPPATDSACASGKIATGQSGARSPKKLLAARPQRVLQPQRAPHRRLRTRRRRWDPFPIHRRQLRWWYQTQPN